MYYNLRVRDTSGYRTIVAKLPYFIIESGQPGYIKINPLGNDRYAQLKQDELNRKLPKPINATVQARAEIHQTRDMLMEDYTDETGETRSKFRDECIVAQADERGRIFIDKDKPEVARALLREIRILHPNVQLDPMGHTNLPGEGEPEVIHRNMGGRPKKGSNNVAFS